MQSKHLRAQPQHRCDFIDVSPFTVRPGPHQRTGYFRMPLIGTNPHAFPHLVEKRLDLIEVSVRECLKAKNGEAGPTGTRRIFRKLDARSGQRQQRPRRPPLSDRCRHLPQKEDLPLVPPLVLDPHHRGLAHVLSLHCSS